MEVASPHRLLRKLRPTPNSGMKRGRSNQKIPASEMGLDSLPTSCGHLTSSMVETMAGAVWWFFKQAKEQRELERR
jgi:hypothetical protein